MNRFALVATSLSTLLGSLSGCASSSNPLMGPGHTPDYAAGFNDGCSSGNASQNVTYHYRKNIKRFDTEKQYAEGWTAGYQKCEDAQIAQLMKV